VTVVRPPLRVALLAAVLASASLVLLAPAPAAAADSARLRDARAHYEQAVAHYNLDEFAPALAEFREAYRIKPDPSFLFNIAQCHRKLGQNEAALDYYRKYLRNMPDAPNRADVERIVAELKAKGVPAAPPETAPDATPVPDAPVMAPVVVAPAPALEAPPPPATTSMIVTAPAPAPAHAPIYKSWWFWTGAGAVVVGAVVVVLLATSKGPQPYMGNLGPNLPLEVR
jgi:tetratricopeptide (TPR) repeat protein